MALQYWVVPGSKGDTYDSPPSLGVHLHFPTTILPHSLTPSLPHSFTPSLPHYLTPLLYPSAVVVSRAQLIFASFDFGTATK